MGLGSHPALPFTGGVTLGSPLPRPPPSPCSYLGRGNQTDLPHRTAGWSGWSRGFCEIAHVAKDHRTSSQGALAPSPSPLRTFSPWLFQGQGSRRSKLNRDRMGRRGEGKAPPTPPLPWPPALPPETAVPRAGGFSVWDPAGQPQSSESEGGGKETATESYLSLRGNF